MDKNYYKILGVPRNANTKQIKSAYRRLARQWHPDLNNNSKMSEEKFKLVSEAYHVLSHSEFRRQYDNAAPNVSGQNTNPSGNGFDSSSGYRYQGEQNETFSMDDMVNAAWEMAKQDMPWIKIAIELQKMRCPRSTAYKIARNVARDYTAQRKQNRWTFFLKWCRFVGARASVAVIIILAVNHNYNKNDILVKNAREINGNQYINLIEKNAVEAMKGGKPSYSYMSGVPMPQLDNSNNIPEPDVSAQPELTITPNTYNRAHDKYLQEKMIKDHYNAQIMDQIRRRQELQRQAYQNNRVYYNAVERQRQRQYDYMVRRGR